MRALIQRVNRASVAVDDQVVGAIGRGLCVFVGVTHSDDEAVARKLAERIWRLRVFDDDAGFMNIPVGEAGGEVLVVSQFTLYGDTRRGRRPSWAAAARAQQAEPLIDRFTAELAALGARVATGRFAAHMHVELVNDGPVTVTVES
ncbi:MAG TPA: D-aminoacyl-tRNA deacylase [Acidimicrobiia bacterium]